MIIDDDEYDNILDKFNVEVNGDGHVMIDMASLIIINESLANFIMENKERMDEHQFWAVAATIEMYRNIYDTLSARHAAEVVPDDLSGLDELE